MAVSYTHLDVYKRQAQSGIGAQRIRFDEAPAHRRTTLGDFHHTMTGFGLPATKGRIGQCGSAAGQKAK